MRVSKLEVLPFVGEQFL